MYSPAEVARRYVETGKSKAALPVGRMLLLGMLAGAFIALAGGSATFAVSYGGRLAGAAVFPAGLAMVLLAGSELFTGNCLLVIPLLERQLTWGRMLRSWGVVYLANVLGAGLVAALTVAAGTFDGVYESVVATAAAKAGLPFLTALLRGVLCNFLVCIAVWMSLAAQSVPGKLAAMYLPIFTFVLCGFEHSVANMFYLPAGILAAGRYGVAAEGLGWASMWTGNLLPVTLGNILGGWLVGVVYWAVYLRRDRRACVFWRTSGPSFPAASRSSGTGRPCFDFWRFMRTPSCGRISRRT